MRSVLSNNSRWARFADGLAARGAVNVKPVRATSAKSKRAEPVSALAEAGRIEFVGVFPRLEQQLSKFTGINGRRDDRADAFCWGVHEIVFIEQFFAV